MLTGVCGQTPPYQADTPQADTTPLGRHPLWQTTPPPDIPWADTPLPLGRHPSRANTPLRLTAPAGDGTHPTGMHSCLVRGTP